MDDYSKELFELVLAPNYRPVKPRQLAKKLHVPEHRLREFKRLIKQLVKSGKLAYADKHRIVPPIYADEFAKRIAGARVKLIASAGHLAHLEQAEPVAKAVLDFIG